LFTSFYSVKKAIMSAVEKWKHFVQVGVHIEDEHGQLHRDAQVGHVSY
jgi:hypothetical protein